MEATGKFKAIVLTSIIGIVGVLIFGLLWLFVFSNANPAGFGWYLFAFATGITMIVLPCTLPLAFVIVPLSMGKGIKKGIGIALSFGAGVAMMLSVYGILAAALGGFALGNFNASLDVVKNWVYFIAGIFAYLFALNEIGLIKFRMPSYTGAAPAFIQKQSDFLKAFLLGLFLGNIGVGCPHPATPLLLVEIASSGNIAYGWTLFLTHALGRILPLVLLAFLAVMGVNGLSWLITKKDKIEKATGWAMIFVAGFILALGLFSHAWWVASGTHTLLEKVTQEHAFLGALNEKLDTAVVHSHGIEETVGHTGLFGLPLSLGNYVLVLLWIIPIWWWWRREKTRVDAIPSDKMVPEKEAEFKVWHLREKLFTIVSILLIVIFIWALPQWFATRGLAGHGHESGTPAVHEHDSSMQGMDHGATEGSMPGMDHGAHGAGYHEENSVTEGLSVVLSVQENVAAREQTPLTFKVEMRPGNTPYDSLIIEHEKYMHVIGVREDLNQFFHIHPTNVGPGLWQVSHIFNEPGKYKVYVDVTDTSGTHSFGQKTFEVKSLESGSPSSISQNQEMLKNVIVGDYQVALEHDTPLVAGKTAEIHLVVHDVFGRGVELENYLAAPMHLAVISQDLTQYLHTHPEGHENHGEEMPASDGHSDHSHSLLPTKSALAHVDTGGSEVESETIIFKVPFLEPGIYKVFAQFRPKGIVLAADEAITAAFLIKVEENTGQVITAVPAVEHAHGTTSRAGNTNGKKVTLALISIVIMALLSRFVYKKIQV